MLRRIRFGSGRYGGDAGVATSVLVMGMAVILAAGFLAFGRIAHASNLRTRAQVGADASALGTLAPLRDLMVTMLMQGMLPDGAGYWGVGSPPETAAQRHADENKTRATKVRLSGIAGDTAMVEAATKDCQLKKDHELTAKEKDDLEHRRNLCTDTSGKKGIGRHGTARAIARVFPPSCTMTPVNGTGSNSGLGAVIITCNGLMVWNGSAPVASRDAITRLFRIRLVDNEDPIDYTGAPAGPGVAGGGGAVVDHCAKDPNKTPTDNMAFGARVVAWALCWLGTPYRWGGGTYSGPSRGICCSPGGHDGRVGVGFDCSGLTLYAVYQASKGQIALGHYTGNQISDPRGRPVPINQLQAGDLLFYGNPTHHVAIYFGDNQMVEAPQTGDVVKKTTLRAPDAARRFG
jgi:hypothetical protein